MGRWLVFSFLPIFAIIYRPVEGHGRLIEPPSRATMWRYGFDTPPNYNDHELYCGGYSRQWQSNGGKCGICGDAWDLPKVSISPLALARDLAHTCQKQRGLSGSRSRFHSCQHEVIAHEKEKYISKQHKMKVNYTNLFPRKHVIELKYVR